MSPSWEDLQGICYTCTDEDIEWIEVLVYINLPLFLVTLVSLLINVWKFLVKQGRYRVLPLVSFYVLAISITLVKVYIACQFAPVMVEFQVFPQLICQTLMFTLILQQSWVNMELCYGIVHNRR